MRAAAISLGVTSYAFAVVAAAAFGDGAYLPALGAGAVAYILGTWAAMAWRAP